MNVCINTPAVVMGVLHTEAVNASKRRNPEVNAAHHIQNKLFGFAKRGR